MLKKHYPGLFKGDKQWEARATDVSAKVHEMVSVCGVRERYDGVSAANSPTPSPT